MDTSVRLSAANLREIGPALFNVQGDQFNPHLVAHIQSIKNPAPICL